MRESDARDRLALWATAFRSLGDVVHLLEDTGQPQHTRNDPHSAANQPEQKAFEGYTNARVLGTGDPGKYLKQFFGDGVVPLTVPPLGSYGVDTPVSFAQPLGFFTTRVDRFGKPTDIASRAGLADYTNRGFFTGGTLPGMHTGISGEYQEPLPPQDLDNPSNDYSISFGPCESLIDADPRIQAAACLHYLHTVPDLVDPNYAFTSDVLPAGFDGPEAPIASESIFAHMTLPNRNFDFTSYVPKTALSLAELETIGNLTIPRAIGYAAGLLDYFFRGQLELSSPPDGLYAVMDQAGPHEVHDGLPVLANGSTFGFQSIQIRARNVTPQIIESGSHRPVPQTMGGGDLVAIAHYHRNPCYHADLSGEMSFREPETTADARVPAGCTTVDDLRTPFSEVSVSQAIPIDNSGEVEAGGIVGNDCVNLGNINTGVTTTGCESDSPLLQFDFSADPIPVNATDLFIQIAYRGRLGRRSMA